MEGEGRLDVLELSQQGYSVVLRQVAGSSLGRCMALFLDVRHPKSKDAMLYDTSVNAASSGLPKDAVLTADPTSVVGTVLQNDECFPCCVRAALRLQRNHEIICIVQNYKGTDLMA